MNATLGQSVNFGVSLKGFNVHSLDTQQCDDVDDGMKIEDTMSCWMLSQ